MPLPPNSLSPQEMKKVIIRRERAAGRSKQMAGAIAKAVLRRLAARKILMEQEKQK